MSRIVAMAFSLLLLVPAHAWSEEIGRAVVLGEEIIIYDDKTWEFAPERTATAAPNCTKVESEKLPVSICLDPDKWTFTELGGDNEIEVKMINRELYLIGIMETTFVEMDDFRKAVVQNAQDASGLNKVEVESEEEILLDDHTFGKMVYSTKVNGIDVTYENYFSNLPGVGSFQFVFFTGQNEYDEMRPTIEEAALGIEVDK